MDWMQILLLLLFLGFPFLEAVLKKRRDPGPPPPAEMDVPRAELPGSDGPEPGAATVPAPATVPGPATAPAPRRLDWPLEAAEPERVEEELTVELPGRGWRGETVRAERPEPLPDSEMVVSLESLAVDRQAEHARFHRKVSAAARVAAETHPGTEIATRLHDPRELKRAFLLAEVLGPPRSQR